MAPLHINITLIRIYINIDIATNVIMTTNMKITTSIIFTTNVKIATCTTIRVASFVPSYHPGWEHME